MHHTHKLWELHNLKSALQHADSVHNRTIPYTLTSISLSFSSFPSLFLSSSFSLYLPLLFSTIVLSSFVTVVREMCSIVKNRAPWNSFTVCVEARNWVFRWWDTDRCKDSVEGFRRCSRDFTGNNYC